jgi:hypothetical protein
MAIINDRLRTYSFSAEDHDNKKLVKAIPRIADRIEIFCGVKLKEGAQTLSVDRKLLVIRRHWRPKLRQWHTPLD